ncbi:PSD1 and planctomycete cytochrome C domain-containing protein [Lentisphaera profundi]|uniref:PSD1 and planctomycete cytochrome C domain-containing protein n=1 Tax=Lentisphaera profundi TaxID=1658616 RepID=A0ABY7VX03_9BACT|nr:PSD1 and planctomycete cytochrome C domain-containing protein [Lentisphaera profundi]WDE97331.1 PSD1 and planctomycete cytochrome C domain-containing protein [Lentisphaera profundi]
MFTRLMFVAALSCSNLIAKEINFNRDILPILSDRCFACHGPDGGEFGEKWKAGLRLDTPEGALANLREVKYQVQTAKRLSQGLKAKEKPSSKRYAMIPGNAEESSLIERIMTDDEDDIMPPLDSHLKLSLQEKDLLRQWIAEGAKYDIHWSFKAPEKAALPEIENTSWPRNEIDTHVLAQLEKRELKPAPEAEKRTWLRRVSQDISGLPPTISQIKDFLEDQSPKAYEKVVDRLLKSSDYAERMTNIWMDNARYADSNGYQFDNARTMWPWRDWVIKAFAENKAWDEFVSEQVAGDLFPKASQDQVIATGFNRNHGYSIEGGIIDEEYRVDYAKDKTHTFGTLFLGLTMECTSCHDHKYDPLTMKDYYSLYAFFNQSSEKGAPGESGRKQKSAAPFISIKTKDGEKNSLRVMIMKDEKRDTFILQQGLYDKPGEKVSAETPAVLASFKGYEKNRLGLAKWLKSPENPLFARVTVNRIWHQFFGRGIVKSVDNFGLQGDTPTHPALLDSLAVDFRENNWDLHQLIRKIVLSATYRQDSSFRKNIEDPENRLLARGPSFRLAAELIRDQALAVSGLMNKKVGGPSVMPYQAAGVWEDLNAPKSHAETYKQANGDDLYRKSLYTYWRRAALHPVMAVFDAPSRDVCAVSRELTNTPLQALVSLHDPTFIEAARCLAEQSIVSPKPIDLAFQSVLSRTASPKELRLLKQYYAVRLKHYQNNQAALERLLKVGKKEVKYQGDLAPLAALTDCCHAIFNLSETITRN